MLRGIFKSEVKGDYWQIIKIIIAIIASILFIQQLMFIGDWIIEKNHYGREINASDYENLNNGEKVWGKLDSVVASAGMFTDANAINLSNYVVKSENEKIIIFRTEAGSKCDKAIQEVLSGKSDGFYFCGYVKPLTGNVRTSVMTTLVANNTLNKNNIDGKINDAFITSMVDASFLRNIQTAE